MLSVAIGYTVNDVLYVWNGKRQVAIADDMKPSHFDLIATPAANQTEMLKTGIEFRVFRDCGKSCLQWLKGQKVEELGIGMFQQMIRSVTTIPGNKCA
ncbi:Gamma-aminobutyric acid receptor subunit alpha-4 [Homalodisca vitripennis]|nr:Gamma-aminobutyric acid receptor subunit alpha-4 [Homalodisca vitripennis]